jgi:integrase
MPILKRHATDYKGVYFIWGEGISPGKKQKIFYVRYRREGKQVDEKAGRQNEDNMTASKASIIRAERISGKRLSNEERRDEIKAKREEENQIKWTVKNLWDEYAKVKASNRGIKKDEARFNRHIVPILGDKTLEEISPLDVDRLRLSMSKSFKPQTVKNTLSIVKRLSFFSIDRRLSRGLDFKITMPKVNNLKTEFLTEDQLKALLKAIKDDPHPVAGKLMSIALFSGLRKSEILNLEWDDVNFERKFIRIRNPKGGQDMTIPLNDECRNVFESITKTDSPFIFPSKKAVHVTSLDKVLRAIRDRAGLPADFRPMHGLRHTFASLLASSGRADLYLIQRLLTHKSPMMTQRYAHLRDESLRRASELAGQLVNEAVKTEKKAEVVNLDEKRG